MFGGLRQGSNVCRSDLILLSSNQFVEFVPFIEFARAAYCAPTKMEGWRCGDTCRAVPGFEPTLTGGNSNGNRIQDVDAQEDDGPDPRGGEASDSQAFLDRCRPRRSLTRWSARGTQYAFHEALTFLQELQSEVSCSGRRVWATYFDSQITNFTRLNDKCDVVPTVPGSRLRFPPTRRNPHSGGRKRRRFPCDESDIQTEVARPFHAVDCS
ncbi:hypothetical protein BJY52DRAFT_21561 [Lactarius psammicola]|nr:hypothetical protein BJY52DRAFT_21561 [Lactarius psammicola]